MKHKAVRIENLMYKGCESHWKCVICGECVPFHCYKKNEFEEKECKGIKRGLKYADQDTMMPAT